MTTEPYDCLTCGACCASPSPGVTYVRLNEADVERLHGTGLPVLEHVEEEPDGLAEPDLVRSLGTKLDPNGRKVCIALEGCAGGVNACSIYPQRPRACRAFEVGGYFCKQARQQFGLPV